MEIDPGVFAASRQLRQFKQVRRSALIVAAEEMAKEFPKATEQVSWLIARGGKPVQQHPEDAA